MNFSPDGSDVGVLALSLGQAHFAALDAPLTQTQQEQTKNACGPRGAFSVPVSVTPIGVAFNVPSIRGLKLTPAVLGGIFSGSISRWDAHEIAEINPGTALPSSEIVPITAAEAGAQTTSATKYLSGSPVWSSGVTSVWPARAHKTEVKKFSDVASKVDQTAGAIAFLDLASIGSRFDTALLSFGGNFVRLSKDSTALAAQEGNTTTTPTGVEFALPAMTDRGFALGVVSYQAFCRQYKNAQLTALVKSWGTFVVSPDGQVASSYFGNVVSPSQSSLQAANALIDQIGKSQ